MDLISLVTSGVNSNEASGPDDDILGVVEGWQDDETHNPDVPAVSHGRGMAPFVFVPFEEVHFPFCFGLLLFLCFASSPSPSLPSLRLKEIDRTIKFQSWIFYSANCCQLEK